MLTETLTFNTMLVQVYILESLSFASSSEFWQLRSSLNPEKHQKSTSFIQH